MEARVAATSCARASSAASSSVCSVLGGRFEQAVYVSVGEERGPQPAPARPQPDPASPSQPQRRAKRADTYSGSAPAAPRAPPPAAPAGAAADPQPGILPTQVNDRSYKYACTLQHTAPAAPRGPPPAAPACAAAGPPAPPGATARRPVEVAAQFGVFHSALSRLPRPGRCGLHAGADARAPVRKPAHA